MTSPAILALLQAALSLLALLQSTPNVPQTLQTTANAVVQQIILETGNQISSINVASPEAPVLLSTDRSSYAPGATMTVTWRNLSTPGQYDWIGLAQPGGQWTGTNAWANGQNVGWMWTNGTASGTGTLVAPSTPGTYQLDYYYALSHDQAVNNPALDSTGATFTVASTTIATTTAQ